MDTTAPPSHLDRPYLKATGDVGIAISFDEHACGYHATCVDRFGVKMHTTALAPTRGRADAQARAWIADHCDARHIVVIH